MKTVSLKWLAVVLPTFSSWVVSSAMTMTTTTNPNNNRVAVVTGASRGIGRGIAVELGKAGYTVYALARSTRSKPGLLGDQRAVADGLDLTVESVAEAVTAAGGIGRGMYVDMSQDESIEGAFERIAEETGGRLDVVVCSAFTTPLQEKLRGDFWNQSMNMWDVCNGVGLRSTYATCRVAAPIMIETANKQNDERKRPPLLCCISSFGGKSYTFNVAYGVGKAGVDRMAQDMGYQLKKYGVATTVLYPGLVKTEANLQMVVDGTWDEASGNLDLSTGETPEFTGKAIVALANLGVDDMMDRSGNVEVVAELAKELQFTEEDGSVPPSIRSLKYLLPNFVFPAIEKESGKPVPGWIKNNIPDYLVPWSTFSSGPPPEADTR
mmetsp:Transcript_3568/g.5397  ORF Transcript_3568/g.5397 Transcript_3568/m.5397 type:complete len:380 (-) Transcript_3568:76-1215(-)